MLASRSPCPATLVFRLLNNLNYKFLNDSPEVLEPVGFVPRPHLPAKWKQKLVFSQHFQMHKYSLSDSNAHMYPQIGHDMRPGKCLQNMRITGRVGSEDEF